MSLKDRPYVQLGPQPHVGAIFGPILFIVCHYHKTSFRHSMVEIELGSKPAALARARRCQREDRIIFREAGDVFDIAYERKYPNTPVR